MRNVECGMRNRKRNIGEASRMRSAECEKIESHAEIMEKSGDEVLDTFDGAKPRFLNRGKQRRSVSTLSIPRALVLSAVEGSDRGVEWVDF